MVISRTVMMPWNVSILADMKISPQIIKFCSNIGYYLPYKWLKLKSSKKIFVCMSVGVSHPKSIQAQTMKNVGCNWKLGKKISKSIKALLRNLEYKNAGWTNGHAWVNQYARNAAEVEVYKCDHSAECDYPPAPIMETFVSTKRYSPWYRPEWTRIRGVSISSAST